MAGPKSEASWTALKFIENLSNMVVRDAIASTLAPVLAGYENLTSIWVHVRCYKYVMDELTRRATHSRTLHRADVFILRSDC